MNPSSFPFPFVPVRSGTNLGCVSKSVPKFPGTCTGNGNEHPDLGEQILEIKIGTDFGNGLFEQERSKIMNHEAAPLIQAKEPKTPPGWPKHYGPMHPDAHGWWLRARLPFHRDCATCLRSPGAPASPNPQPHKPTTLDA